MQLDYLSNVELARLVLLSDRKHQYEMAFRIGLIAYETFASCWTEVMDEELIDLELKQLGLWSALV